MKLKQQGSIMVIVLAVATLTAMTVFTILLSLKTFIHRINMQRLQLNTSQLILSYAPSLVTSLSDGIDLTALPWVTDSKINDNNPPYSLHQSLEAGMHIEWPPNGFSLGGLYSLQLVRHSAWVSNSDLQSRKIISTLGCSLVSGSVVNSTPESTYRVKISPSHQQPPEYEFDILAAEIRRASPTPKVLLALEYQQEHRFGRPDFLLLNTGERPRLAMAFIHHSSQSGLGVQVNRLFILFDDPFFDQTHAPPVSIKELSKLNHDHGISYDAPGYVYNLSSGKLSVSAITAINQKLFFITQRAHDNGQTRQTVYKNELFRVDLTPGQQKVVQTRPLSDSTELFELVVNSFNQTDISVGTQFEPALMTERGVCNTLYSHEG